MVITILPGEKGVFYSRFLGGTDLQTVYGEGLHLIFPWDKMYIYNTRIQQLTLPLTLLSKDGLQIELDISIRYQVMIDLLPQLQVLVGTQYLDTIIIPSVTSAVRQTLGEYRPDELYASACQELQDQILVEAITEISRVPINLHNVVVKHIQLPDSLNVAIDKKLVAEQDYLRYQYVLKSAAQEAKRKTIEGYGISKYQELINKRMTDNFLRFEGISATKELATSSNAKMVMVGGKDGLPIILNGADAPVAPLPLRCPNNRR
ncbi:MAG: prohibitin family protein [Desulfobulbus sp.]|nr:prohibitin family protein [Desulfobulbus sp.]